MRASTIVNKSRFIANIGASTFQPADLYLLFVAVDTDDGTIRTVWFVPSIDFADKTEPNGQNRHRFSASMKTATEDQWSGYRLEPAELAQQILDDLDDLAARQR